MNQMKKKDFNQSCIKYIIYTLNAIIIVILTCILLPIAFIVSALKLIVNFFRQMLNPYVIPSEYIDKNITLEDINKLRKELQRKLEDPKDERRN